MKVKDIAKHIEEWCPRNLAEAWDNVGLLVGDPEQEVKKVMVALDAIEEVIDEAIEKNADLIVTHHPFLMNEIKRITTEAPTGKYIHKLIKNNISVYSAHTNLDSAKDGINDFLVGLFGLREVLPFEYKGEDFGIGRVGSVDEQKLGDFALKVKQILKLDTIRVIGDLETSIRKVALCSGSGMSLLDSAVSSGADVYLTGDVKYHSAQEALALGINVIDAGHYGTENIIVPVMKKYLEKLEGIEVVETSVDGNPFKVI